VAVVSLCVGAFGPAPPSPSPSPPPRPLRRGEAGAGCALLPSPPSRPLRRRRPVVAVPSLATEGAGASLSSTVVVRRSSPVLPLLLVVVLPLWAVVVVGFPVVCRPMGVDSLN
jgi:hypothetical protein